MTSNLGSHQIQELSGSANYDAMKKAVMEIVGQHFRPEFINRVDETVVFRPLGREQIRTIAKIQIGRLRERLHEQDIAIELSEAALDKIGETGFDPVYGARPLKRAIQQYLENPLAQQLLLGEYIAGDVIEVGVKNDELIFGKVKPMKAVI
jgi:ATP-dependent Clp protease ATP-binding subunit ClpB